MLLSAYRASKVLGVSSSTLRKWDKDGYIQSVRTPSNIRLYDISSISRNPSDFGPVSILQRLALRNASTDRGDRGLETDAESQNRGGTIVYCRVSSKKQQGDLDRQVSYLAQRHPGSRVVKDIASGVNFNRPGLCGLVRCCIRGNVKKVVVAHRDRLARIGIELLELLFKTCGVTLLVDDHMEERPTDDTNQLAEDLMAIVHVFSCRQYGKRSYGAKRKRGQGDGLLQRAEGTREDVVGGEGDGNASPDDQEQGQETEAKRRGTNRKTKTQEEEA
jgi:putative resolvase